MITAFFDESGHSSETPYVSIAAFVAENARWKSFDAAWNAALQATGAEYLHMRELAHFRGAFTGWNEQRRRDLLARAVAAINADGLVAVGAVMAVNDFRNLPPEAQEAFQDPFFCCLQEVAYGVALQGLHEPKNLRIKAVFSQQDEFGGKLRLLWDSLRARDTPSSKVEALSFADMRASPGLQAADLLAYELRHFYDQRAKKPDCTPRWPFAQIVQHQRRGLNAAMLKYLPAWYLELQSIGGFDEGMRVLASQPGVYEPLLRELTPRL